MDFEAVARAALSAYPSKSLQSGDTQWTVFTAIVQQATNTFEAVACGTGSKCLSKDELSDGGDVLNDSHAEVICRRAFVRYLMHQMSLRADSRIFNVEGHKFSLKESIKFHMFTTHSPCGDATIYPMAVAIDDEPQSKRPKLEDCRDNFTGAKIINNQSSDLLAQDTGSVRTKPGRGVRTLSVSCSDKMAKWIVLGVQGCLLSYLLVEPIYIDSITMARNAPYNRDALVRALYGRFARTNDESMPSKRFTLRVPELYVSSQVDFPHIRHDNKVPSPTSVAWCAVPIRPLEVSVNGRRLGVAKKNRSKPSSRLLISKMEILKQFMSLICDEDRQKYCNVPYSALKQELGQDYHDTWLYLKKFYFLVWSEKPVYLVNFCLDQLYIK